MEENKPFSIAVKWFIVPSVIVAIYVAYNSTFGYNKKTVLWKNILVLLVVATFFTAIILGSFEGYLITYNCKVGTQSDTLITGQVVRLDFPTVKKSLNKYSIEIQTDKTQELIKISVPTNDYSVGQFFRKEMKCGSLGVLYSK